MKYVEDHYRTNDDFDSVTGLSQIMQAEAIRYAVETHRRNMPYCMGTLYWQFNDCWPVISWSSIDHGGNWKALHYAARKFFKPILVSMRDLDEVVDVYVVNDQHQGLEAEMKVELFHFNGDKLLTDSSQIKVKPFSSTIFNSFDRAVILDGSDSSALMLRAELLSNGEILDRSHQFFKRPKDLSIPVPDFEYGVELVDGKYMITIRSNSFLYQLHLISSKVRGVFSDNYFDMLPNEVVMIDFEPDENKELKESDLKIRTIHEMMN
jgi:beta-mannosidase